MENLASEYLKEKCGIIILTGEAERVTPGMRCLCDITQAGHDLLARYLGVAKLELFAPMNTVGVGSCMLSYNTLKELRILHWLLQAERNHVAGMDGDLYGLSHDEWEEWHQHGRQIDCHWCLMQDQRGLGDRCTHAFTGRTM